MSQDEARNLQALIKHGHYYATQQSALPTPKYNPFDPPPGYVCFRCNTPGHFKRDCPTQNDPEYDPVHTFIPQGVPRYLLKKINQNGTPIDRNRAVYKTLEGDFATVVPDTLQRDLDRLRGTVQPSDEDRENEKERHQFTCHICYKILRDAVVVSCCKRTFCDDCITPWPPETTLQCPHCGDQLKINDLQPDKVMQNRIYHWRRNKERKRSVRKYRSNLYTPY